jgi:hypothetical protein
MLPPVARWMAKRGRVKFQREAISEISFDLTTHIPDLTSRPLGLEILLNGVKLSVFSLYRHGWLELRVPVPESLSQQAGGDFELELRVDRTWQPRPVADETRDDRELSVAVCNIVIQ